MKKLSLIAFVSLTLAGCGKDFTKASSFEVQQAATTKTSEFDSATFTYLPNLYTTQERGLLGGVDRIHYTLGISKPKDGTPESKGVMVSIDYYDTEWRFYESADFTGGIPADFKLHNRNVSNCDTYKTLSTRCDYKELFTIKLTDDFIDKNSTGFSIRLNSKQGKQNIINIPANYMQALISLSGKK